MALVSGGDPVMVVVVVGDSLTPLYTLIVYLLIGLPPSAGATHETVALSSPGFALTSVGANGFVAGVTAFECSEAGPVPAVLVASTVKV